LGQADPATTPHYEIYFGNLHSHTSYSDGTGTPATGYKLAKEAGLDFLAITEHNHRKAEMGAKERRDGKLIATSPALYQDVIRAAQTVTENDRFVALYGQEFSTISEGNHVNVFDVDAVIDDNQVRNGDFRTLYQQWLPAHRDSTGQIPILQFNHPDLTSDLREAKGNAQQDKGREDDYGYDEYGRNFKSLRAGASAVRLIEIVSGPAMKKSPVDKITSAHRHEQDYLGYLAWGFHLAPTANQDNHYLGQLGSSSPARTAVLANRLTRADLLEALRARRCYATEDSDLQIRFTVNGQPMGSILSLSAGNLDIRVEVADPSEPRASYTIELYSGKTDGQKATVIERKPLTGDGEVRFDSYRYVGDAHGSNEVYYFVKVMQTTVVQAPPNGSNNAMERAWTAPIWLSALGATGEGPVAKYAWSRNSSIYHDSTCRVVSQIRPQNLERGETAPLGKSLHQGCPLH
jgi:hypothetical protein